MIASLRMMATCRWSARRIQRYIDADPAAPLSAAELDRLEAHLAVCDRCAAAVSTTRGVKAVLTQLARRRAPDPAALARLRLRAQQLSRGEAT